MDKQYFGENISLKNMNTFKIGGTAKYLFLPTSIKVLEEHLKYFKDNNIKYFVIGLGSNVILPDEDFDGVVISLSNFNDLIIEGDKCIVGAGLALPLFNNKLLKEGFTNFAWAGSIPGSIGGSIYGNAEAHKESMFDNLIYITVYSDGEIKKLYKEDIDFGYRYTSLKNEIILDASFNLVRGNMEETLENINTWKNFRIEKQPFDKKSAGSTFRNPDVAPAGKLIEDAGLKGLKIGGAMVSNKHANFIVNEDNATSADIKKLINKIKEEVKTKYDIDLVLENKIIEWNEL